MMTIGIPMSSTVRDNPQAQRFEMDLSDGLAVANYRLTPGVVTIYHTEVPPQHEGQGLASKLVTGALELIRARGDKVVSRCGFLTAFLRKHAEYNDLMG
jgi:predicted GNAT family acetyltransferase